MMWCEESSEQVNETIRMGVAGTMRKQSSPVENVHFAVSLHQSTRLSKIANRS
jgi:hypothetical protein